jgi:putative protein kinase ArgK-like GTPase of G3E family
MSETNTAVLTEDLPKAVAQANPFAERASQEEAKPRKASLLDLVTTRKRRRPVLAMLYGPPGVGKSTFGASAPSVDSIRSRCRSFRHLKRWLNSALI